MLSPLRADTIDAYGHPIDSKSRRETTDWPYAKLVFAGVLAAGYAGAILALIYPFYMYMH
jgi:hypothetical protein